MQAIVNGKELSIGDKIIITNVRPLRYIGGRVCQAGEKFGKVEVEATISSITFFKPGGTTISWVGEAAAAVPFVGDNKPETEYQWRLLCFTSDNCKLAPD